MKSLVHFIFAFILLTLFNSCQQDESISFLAIAHTRQSESNQKEKVIKEVEEIPFQNFDYLLLGGDMILKSSETKASLNYLNEVFQIDAPTTLWAMGNHDYQDHPEFIPSFTNRETFYAHKIKGLTFLVLDTQLDSCNVRDAQYELFKETIGTLQKGEHLIILHHKLIWLPGHPELNDKIQEITNGMLGDCFYCLMENNFYEEIYPELVSLEKRGIQVILLGGDIGFKVNQFEYETTEGITYLATGLEDGRKDNKVLLFNFDNEDELSWEFKDL